MRKTIDKLLIDAQGSPSKKKDIFLKKENQENNQNGGANLFLMNKKEREKFQELSNLNNKQNKYENIFKKGNNGKIFLNPLTGPNKVEVSFKATLDINNLPPVIKNKNRIKLGNIQEE